MSTTRAGLRLRLTCVAAVLGSFLVCYCGAAAWADGATAHTLVTRWDQAIPFVGWSVWVYVAGLVLVASPVLLLPSRESLTRAAFAYLLVIGAAAVTFSLFPVSSGALRADVGALDAGSLSAWAARAVWGVDPPLNSFPSLHVALGTLAVLALGRARPSLKPWLYGALGLVVGSVFTMKQHFLLDAAGGFVLALASGKVADGSFRRMRTRAA